MGWDLQDTLYSMLEAFFARHFLRPVGVTMRDPQNVQNVLGCLPRVPPKSVPRSGGGTGTASLLPTRSYLKFTPWHHFLTFFHCTPQESMAEQLAGGALCPPSGGPDGNVMAARAERLAHRSTDTGPIPQRYPAHFVPQSLAPAVAGVLRYGSRKRWVWHGGSFFAARSRAWRQRMPKWWACTPRIAP